MKKILLLVVFLPIFAHASPQDNWMAELRDCESQGKDTIVILDSNDKHSYGRYMFQLDTFYGYGQQYGIIPLEMPRWEAKLLILNPSIQTAIARHMLDDGLDYHWKNCRDKVIGYRYPIPYKFLSRSD